MTRGVLIGLAAAALVGVLAVAFGGYGGSGADSAADPGDPGLLALGERVYAANCASCHGAKLEGQPNWQTALPEGGFPAPPHDASGHTWHHPDDLLFAYTKHGGEAVVGGGFVSNMPGFGDRLSDREIWAVIAYIKSRWPDDVRAQQAALDAAER